MIKDDIVQQVVPHRAERRQDGRPQRNGETGWRLGIDARAATRSRLAVLLLSRGSPSKEKQQRATTSSSEKKTPSSRCVLPAVGTAREQGE